MGAPAFFIFLRDILLVLGWNCAIMVSVMICRIRKSHERGHADMGWLDSRHSFSFGEYQDPRHMGFRSLRVINEDRVAPGAGFPMHAHRDMEIFSYVLSGQLEHKDSMGNGRVLKPGELQLMSAGKGVMHSEFNPSPDQWVHFLQIWIRPERAGLEPAYTEWRPQPGQAEQSKVLLISADGRDGSACIRQDAEVWLLRLRAGERIEFPLRQGRGLWLQVMAGVVMLGGDRLAEGDAAAVEDSTRIELVAAEDGELLLFDLK